MQTRNPPLMSLGPLSVQFERHLHVLFLERLQKSGNVRALKFIGEQDVERVGVTCNECGETKPFYSYGQDKSYKHCIRVNKCTKCYDSSRCPWERMLSGMKGSSKSRGHPTPEYTVEDLKEVWKTQRGRCIISGSNVKVKYGDGDPYNMSPERLDNTKGYTRGNVVLICQWFQIGQGHDYLPLEIRSWFQYDMEGDDFVFDPTTFDKPAIVYRKRRKVIKTYDDVGTLVSKICTDCGVDKGVGHFSGIKASCKPCASIIAQKRCNATPHRFVQQMARNAKTSTKCRGTKRKRNDNAGISVDDIFKLAVSTIIRQGGRCVITGRPFVYQTCHKFAPSPDRIDNTKGYVEGNVEMIIAPLNTARKPPNAELRALIEKDNLF